MDARLTWWTFVHAFEFMEFEWNSAKATANLHDHGVLFSEAATVLTDEFALTREDKDALDEQRFVTVGMSSAGQILVVYTHREPDRYRIISVWTANSAQRRQYEKSRS